MLFPYISAKLCLFLSLFIIHRLTIPVTARKIHAVIHQSAGLQPLPVPSACAQSGTNSKNNTGKTYDLCDSTSQCLGSAYCIALVQRTDNSSDATCDNIRKTREGRGTYCLCVPIDFQAWFACDPPRCPSGEGCGFRKNVNDDSFYLEQPYCISNEMTIDCYTEITKQLSAGTSQQPSVSPTASVTPSRTPTPSPSRTSTPSPSRTPLPSSEKVCIGIHHLQDLTSQDLVFETNPKTTVLCDRNHSCATAGHMVVWHGSAMMMKTYCEQIGNCRQEVMIVNSPRWRRATSIASLSKGLDFTVYAARFESTFEETILQSIIRIESRARFGWQF